MLMDGETFCIQLYKLSYVHMNYGKYPFALISICTNKKISLNVLLGAKLGNGSFDSARLTIPAF